MTRADDEVQSPIIRAVSELVDKTGAAWQALLQDIARLQVTDHTLSLDEREQIARDVLNRISDFGQLVSAHAADAYWEITI